MVKRAQKQADGKYHIKGKRYELNTGSRAQVWHGTAFKTTGGLTKSHLHKNKHGRIVSMKKHKTAKKEKRLEKAGYKPKKGSFVVMRKSLKNKSPKRKTRKARKSRKSRK